MTSICVRRRSRPAALLAALVLLVAGCGGTSATDTFEVSDGRGKVGGEIRLSWWGGETRNEKTNAVADLFERTNSGVTIEREVADFDNYWNRLNVQSAGQNLPCVTQMQARQLNDYTTRRVLQPLDKMVEAGVIDVSGIPEQVLDTGRGRDGRLYMIPTGAAYDAMAINTTMAEQAGVGLPPNGYDWDFFFDWVRRAQPGLPEGVSATGLRGGQPNALIAYVQGRGEQLFKDGRIGFSKQLLTEYWTEWERIRKAGVTVEAAAMNEEPQQPEAGYTAQGRVMSDVRPGNALTPMQETIDGQAPGQQLTNMPLPSGPRGQGNVLITSGLSIASSCDNVPTAAAFIDFWANDEEGARIYASDNGAVTHTELLQQQLADPELSATKKRELEVYQQIVEEGAPAIIYPPGYQTAFEDTFTRTYEDISFGRMTVPEAVDSFFEQTNLMLGSE